MQILYWDVETTDLELAIRTYQLKNSIRYFRPDTIRRDWSMLGASWAFNDEKPQAISVSPKAPLDDEYVIKYMHGVLEKADVLIGHNSDNFDIKKFNTRAVFYGLPPLSPKVQIDTLKIARKYFKFTSNQLGYICQYLGLSAKDESPDWELCIDGDVQELRNMREYNKNDVIATRDLYKKLSAWHHTHPHLHSGIHDVVGLKVDTCMKCGSPDLQQRGFRYLASGRKRRKYKCNSCGGWQAGKLI